MHNLAISLIVYSLIVILYGAKVKQVDIFKNKFS